MSFSLSASFGYKAIKFGLLVLIVLLVSYTVFFGGSVEELLNWSFLNTSQKSDIVVDGNFSLVKSSNESSLLKTDVISDDNNLLSEGTLRSIDEAGCDELFKREYKARCVINLIIDQALEEEDRKVCESLTEKEDVDSCFDDYLLGKTIALAVLKGDVSICDDLKDIVVEGQRIPPVEFCQMQVVFSLESKNSENVE